MRGWRCFDVIISAGYRNVLLFVSHPFILSLYFDIFTSVWLCRPHSLRFFVKVIEQAHELAGSDIYFLKYILCIRKSELLPSDYSKLSWRGQKGVFMFTGHTWSVQQGGREGEMWGVYGRTSDWSSSMHSLTEWLRLLYYEPVMAPKKRVEISCGCSGVTTDNVKSDMRTLLHTCLGGFIW